MHQKSAPPLSLSFSPSASLYVWLPEHVDKLKLPKMALSRCANIPFNEFLESQTNKTKHYKRVSVQASTQERERERERIQNKHKKSLGANEISNKCVFHYIPFESIQVARRPSGLGVAVVADE